MIPGTRLAAVALTAVVAVGCAAGTGDADPHPAADATATHSQSVRISAVGDTILGSTPSLPADPSHYLDPVAEALRWHHQFVFGNLEGTLTNETSGKCGGSSGGNCFAFRNPPRFARYLAAAGFTVLNNANNHSHDFGAAGLDQTVRAIHHAGMKQTGLPGQITVAKSGGHKVAFVGFAPYAGTADLLRLHAAAKLVRKAATKAPVVVVYMHAGAEGSNAQHVTGGEEYFLGEDRGNPEKFAHRAIRNGADLVIASGPHVLRGMQFYRGHLIAYSLGNFANYHNFAGGGVLSDSAILHVRLSATGAFERARLRSVRLGSDGRASIGGDSVAEVRKLSKADFGHSAARLGKAGVIRPPR